MAEYGTRYEVHNYKLKDSAQKIANDVVKKAKGHDVYTTTTMPDQNIDGGTLFDWIVKNWQIAIIGLVAIVVLLKD